MGYQIRLNSVDVTAPCGGGTIAATIGRNQTVAYEGDKRGAVEWLKAYPIGASVEAREIRGGQSVWIRSCMNKPALWADIEGRA